jgi:hypothetical protein
MMTRKRGCRFASGSNLDVFLSDFTTVASFALLSLFFLCLFLYESGTQEGVCWNSGLV